MSPSEDPQSLREELTADDPAVRGDAAFHLHGLVTDPERSGDAVAGVLWDLAGAVDDDDRRTRAYARAAFLECSVPESLYEDAIAALDGGAADRRRAAAALLRFGPSHPAREDLVAEHTRRLTAALTDPTPAVRRHVAAFWRRTVENENDTDHAAVVRPLSPRLFSDPDPDVRASLLVLPFTYDRTAADADRPRAALAGFVDRLDDPDPSVRAAALAVFPRHLLDTVGDFFGAPDLATRATEHVAARLTDADDVVRKRAAAVLAGVGRSDDHPLVGHSDPAAAVDALLAACRDATDESVGLSGLPATRDAASRVLVRLADDHPDWLRPHAAALVDALDCEHADARTRIAYAAARVVETAALEEQIAAAVADLAETAPETAGGIVAGYDDPPAVFEGAFGE